MSENKELRKAIEGIKFRFNIKTQKEIAELLGCNYTYLSDLLRGNNKISEEFSDKLKETFGVNPNFILNGTEPIWIANDIVLKGDNNTQVAGNSNNVNSSAEIQMALKEISEMRKLIQEQVKNNQDQFNRLMSVIEKLTEK